MTILSTPFSGFLGVRPENRDIMLLSTPFSGFREALLSRNLLPPIHFQLPFRDSFTGALYAIFSKFFQLPFRDSFEMVGEKGLTGGGFQLPFRDSALVSFC